MKGPDISGCRELQDEFLRERRVVDKEETEACADQEGGQSEEVMEQKGSSLPEEAFFQ